MFLLSKLAVTSCSKSFALTLINIPILRFLNFIFDTINWSLPEIRDKMAVARAHQGHNGCEFV